MLKINKDNWITYRFDEIAQNISERVEPADTDLKIYVGLEHLDPGSIHIQRHGYPSDVKGTKLKVYKGDVIFGKRRAYQRKASVANFDGICSAHSMVLRANSNIINQELFPFFIHSDAFMHRAIDISEGSLSPTIKWNTLARQEFLIPPIEMQDKYLKLFLSADKTIEQYLCYKKHFLTFRKSFFNEIFKNIKEYTKLKNLPIKTISGLWKSEEDDCIQVKIIRSTEFSDFGEINLTKLETLPVSKRSFEKSKLEKNDIIIERSGGGPDQPVGRVCLFDLDENNFSFSNFTSVIRATESKNINPKFIFYYLLHFYELGRTARIQKQTTGIRNLDYDLYQNIKIPFPSVNKQNKIVEKINSIESTRKDISNIIDKTSIILKELINSIF